MIIFDRFFVFSWEKTENEGHTLGVEVTLHMPLALTAQQEERLVVLNAMAFLLHLALAIVSGVVGNINLAPDVFTTKNTVVFNSSSAAGGFDIVPRYVKSGAGFPVTALVVAFFSITAFFHIGNVTFFYSFYLDGIENCTTPTRWVEYTITATLMITIIAYLSGLRDDSSIVAVAGLTATTMLFGALTELLARPAASGDSWQTSLFMRSVPHVTGYVPYFFAWFVILFSFFGSGGACAAPDFVWVIIIGQFVLFSSFVFPQLYQLRCPPSAFCNGEIGFITLSFISKAFLGIVLLVGGIAQDTFRPFENVDVRNTTCDIVDLGGV